MPGENQFATHESLEELASVFGTSVLSPVTEIMEQIRISWQDPAGFVLIKKLEHHRDNLEYVKRILEIGSDIPHHQ